MLALLYCSSITLQDMKIKLLLTFVRSDWPRLDDTSPFFALCTAGE